MKPLLSLAACLVFGWQAHAALVTSHHDAAISTPVVDGIISANEYGPGNGYAYSGGGAGFGGQLGAATMYMKSDAFYMYIGFSNLGIPTDGNQYLVYFHTRAGGYQPDGVEMNDTSDGGRANVTRLSTDGVEYVTFFNGITNAPDFALLFNNRTNGFQTLFDLKGAGTNHLVIPRSASSLGASQIEFRIDLASLSVTNGGTIDFTGLEISGDGYLSNEGIPNPNLTTNAGYNGGTIVYSNFHRFETAMPATSGAMTGRVNATSLNLPSSAPGAATNSFSTVNAFPTVAFTNPICIRTPPGETNRLFVLEQGGRIVVITNLVNPTRTVFMNIASRVTFPGESGLLSMDFHPGYATNGYFFVWYTASGSGQSNRLSRFQVSAGNPDSANTNSEVILIGQLDDCSNHNGGDIHFGPDGYLYLSLGDEGGSNDNCNGGNSQRIDKDFFSGVIRIDVDKKPGSLPPNHHRSIIGPTNYAIPPDNPFIGYTQFNGIAVAVTNVRTEFWAVGLRNPFRMSFDKPTGDLYLGDVGQDAREEINIITKGGNYGWKWREGNVATTGIGAPPAGFTNYINPIAVYSHPPGVAVTGGIVYRGDGIPDLYGKYLFTDYGSGHIWSITNNGTNASSITQLTSDGGIAGFGADPRNGDVLLADAGEGQIKKLVVTTSSGSFPQTLADTGIFLDLINLTPQAGVEPYDINVPFWSDNAIKSRWFSVPSTNLFIGFTASANWSIPTSTVWIKHFDLELTNGEVASRRRLETRVMVKNASGDGGYGVTYRWGSSITNANLVPENGLDEPIVINDSGTIRTQLWRYPGRSECIVCHNATAGFALSFKTPQMNRDHTYTGGTTNQLLAMQRAGYFNNAVTNVHLLRKLAHPTNTEFSVAYRVRSYLQANCAQCHTPGGPTPAQFDARIVTPISQAGLIDGALANNGGNTNNRVVVRGSTPHSMMLNRISVRGAGQMPPLGSNLLDTQNIAMVTAWINGEATGYETLAEWQVRHFGSTAAPDAQLDQDPDGDGQINEYEYLTGTQPTNNLDAWEFTDLILTGAVPALSYDRTAQTGFDVQVNTSLVDGVWLSLDVPENAPVFGSSPVSVTVPDPDATNLIERFYRVRAYEP
jgi:glucose/arabinose dehydrogenase/mono/diheme cytochrome c family protein